MPVELTDPSVPAVLDREVADLGPAGRLRLVGYAPHAKVTYALDRDIADGGTALRLHIEGPRVNTNRWLIADDLNHAMLNSSIGRWSAHLSNDRGQFTRFVDRQRQRRKHDRALMVATRDGRARKVFNGVREGQVLRLPDAGVSVRVLRYLPWCSYDLSTKRILNLGDRPINPAVEVEVVRGGSTSTHLVFARAEAQRIHEAARSVPAPVELSFHQVISRLAHPPAFSLFVTDPDAIMLVTVLGDVVIETPLRVGDLVGVPRSAFRFQVAEIVQPAKLVEVWTTTDSTTGPCAVRLQLRGPDDAARRDVWIADGGVHRVALPEGFAEIAFGRGPSGHEGLPPKHPTVPPRPHPKRPK